MFQAIRQLTRHSAIYGMGHILTRAVSFLLLPLYTNFLTHDLFGVASLLFAYMAVMTVIYGLGLDSAFFRYYIPAGNLAEKRQIFSTALGSSVIVASIFSMASMLTAGPLAGLLLGNRDYAYLVSLSAGILWFDALAAFPLLLIRAEERPLFFALNRFANVVLNLGLNYVLVVIFERGLDGVFEANLVSSAFSFFVLLPFSWRHFQPRIDRATLAPLLRYGLPYLPATCAVAAIDTVDRYILKALTDIETVGIYSAGYRLGMIMGLMVAAFRFAWMSFFLHAAARENAPALFARILTYFITVCAMVFLVVSFFIDDVVRFQFGNFTLFAEEYWQSTAIVPIVLFGYALYGVAINFLVGIHLQEKTGYLPLITGAGVIANVALNFLLIPFLGMAGAAWATVLAYAVMAVFAYGICRRLYPIAYEFKRIFKVAVLAAGIFFVHYFWRPGSFPSLGLVFFFPLALFAAGFFEKSELQRLTRFLHLSS